MTDIMIISSVHNTCGKPNPETWTVWCMSLSSRRWSGCEVSECELCERMAFNHVGEAGRRQRSFPFPTRASRWEHAVLTGSSPASWTVMLRGGGEGRLQLNKGHWSLITLEVSRWDLRTPPPPPLTAEAFSGRIHVRLCISFSHFTQHFTLFPSCLFSI